MWMYVHRKHPVQFICVPVACCFTNTVIINCTSILFHEVEHFQHAQCVLMKFLNRWNTITGLLAVIKLQTRGHRGTALWVAANSNMKAAAGTLEKSWRHDSCRIGTASLFMQPHVTPGAFLRFTEHRPPALRSLCGPNTDVPTFSRESSLRTERVSVHLQYVWRIERNKENDVIQYGWASISPRRAEEAAYTAGWRSSR
jgi:hypothetical protein